jgi:Co/Zn/Cd efflux system component
MKIFDHPDSAPKIGQKGLQMQKTTFKISKMDCPSEEQLIRMKLSGFMIKSLDFDIPNRTLVVFHSDNYEQLLIALDSLKFDTSLVDSVSMESHESSKNNSIKESRLLWQILGINIFFFVFEMLAGFSSKSLGLIADSLDMLADGIVYGLALFSVGGSMLRKKNVAKAAAYFQMSLAILGLIESIRRFAGADEAPVFQTIIAVSIFALIGNAICLYLLQKSKSEDAHMKASMIFTSNDIIVNLGVIIAGGLVYLTNSKYPDLVVGAIVFFIVGKGSFKILSISK